MDHCRQIRTGPLQNDHSLHNVLLEYHIHSLRHRSNYKATTYSIYSTHKQHYTLNRNEKPMVTLAENQTENYNPHTQTQHSNLHLRRPRSPPHSHIIQNGSTERAHMIASCVVIHTIESNAGPLSFGGEVNGSPLEARVRVTHVVEVMSLVPSKGHDGEWLLALVPARAH
uniref:Uncharacterized protein n=1 Tax=Opuntia streptacantha TaxID=393608 RepID=A0A7C9E5Q9_OPUST